MPKVYITQNFEKEAKPLFKRYASFGEDLKKLIIELQSNPTLGTPLGADCFKIRMSISSKGKGKSGGAIVITCFKVIKDFIALISVFDKSEQESVSTKQLKEILKKANLLK